MKEGAITAPLVAVLELAASERPQVLDFQLATLLNSVMRPAVHELAADFGVPVEKLGPTLCRASLDLDRLEKLRGVWRDPGQFLESPNVAALLHLCAARVARVRSIARRRRLTATQRRLQAAYELARSRAWIEDFIGPPRTGQQKVSGAGR